MSAKFLLTLTLLAPAPEAQAPSESSGSVVGQPGGDTEKAEEEGPEGSLPEARSIEEVQVPIEEGDDPVSEQEPPAPEVMGAETATAAAQPEGPEFAEGGFDMGDIFGDGSDVEEMEELPEDGADDDQGGGGLVSRMQGDLSFEFAALTSLYVGVDNVSDGPDGKPKRWTRSYNGQRGDIDRNENRLEFYFNYRPNEHIELVGGIEPVFMGTPQVAALNDLSSRQMIRPFHMESDKAYMGIIDIVPGLDLKVGRQIVIWGTADKFNPTNNINSDDFEDRPLFTEPIANQMAVLDYAAFEDKLQIQAIWIPLFYPALLPPSASTALTDPKAPVPFSDDEDLADLVFLQDFLGSDVRFTPNIDTVVVMPKPSLRNGQGAFKVGTKLGDVDMSASYYFGFHDVPLPYYARANKTYPDDEWLDEQPDEAGCCFESTAFLRYPGMHVIGADMATQVPFLGHMGFWAEGAMFLPTQRNEMTIEIPTLVNLPSTEGIDTSMTGITADKKPFFKLTTGVDYTVGKHVLLLGQYIRGFIDEFGAGNMGNFVMGGTQVAFRGRHVIVQLFGVLSMPRQRDLPTLPGASPGSTGRDLDAIYSGDSISGVIAPELTLVPEWGYLTFKLGAFALVGKSQTKFGQLAAGSSLAYLKMQGRF